MEQASEYVSKCKNNPIIKHNSSSTDVRELLLSSTAADPEVTLDKITKAFDELIGLKYPLINRILEAAAYYCKIGLLKIYFVNGVQAGSSQSSATHQQGYFSANRGLIVLAGGLFAISNALIHELTHAVRYYLKKSNDFAYRHHDFCKNQFPALMSKYMVATTQNEEQNELAEIEKQAHWFSELYKARLSHCNDSEFHALNDHFKPGFQKIVHRRHAVAAQQQLRAKFYSFFQPYNVSDYAEEFLPFFLDQFVTAALHEQIPSFFEFNNDSGENKHRDYLQELLARMYAALPSKVINSFIKDEFRVALEEFLKPKWNSFIKLDDDVFFECSVAEPQRIINSIIN